MTFEEAAAQLVAMAQRNGGTVTAAQVEADSNLAAERGLVCRAARTLATGTNALGAEEDADTRDWFPYSTLTFSDLYGKR